MRLIPEHGRATSWLCPTRGDRERFLEMQRRLGVARLATIVMAAIVIAVVEPHVGWGLFPFGVVSVAIALLGGRHLERRRRPELWVFFTTVVNVQLTATVGAILAGGPRTPLVSLIALPVVIVATRFSGRGLLVGAPASVFAVLAATVGVHPGYVSVHPESLVVPLGLVVCIALYMHAVVASDVRYRADSTLDELTGLLNRRALEPRLAEIAQQAAITGQPVSVVAGDLDHFKRVNDQWGHATGDLVLREAAAAMRGRLRNFELLYRIGGEEFLLILPGATLLDAVQIAEMLRAAIEAAHPGGLDVTCSFGVATSHGAEVAVASLMKESDEALYAAKRGGRNRVEFRRPPSQAAA
jgi:diguanylate cyclase (GGDEF)-like protein